MTGFRDGPVAFQKGDKAIHVVAMDEWRWGARKEVILQLGEYGNGVDSIQQRVTSNI